MKYLFLLSLLACSAGSIFTTKTNKTLRVMIIDTGLNPNIPELRPYLNFYNPILMKDENGHGSHVAGIIATKACPGVEIIPCFGAHDADLSDGCLKLALTLNVQIVNFSMGGYFKQKEEFDILKKLEARGIWVIAAAGNEGFDLNIKPFYPASYPLANIITVGALLPDGQQAFFSNYREFMTWEPGYKIESFNKEGERVKMSGTSMAAAVHTSKMVEKWCQSN